MGKWHGKTQLFNKMKLIDNVVCMIFINIVYLVKTYVFELKVNNNETSKPEQSNSSFLCSLIVKISELYKHQSGC